MNLMCPQPFGLSPIIVLGHGGGGSLTQELIRQVFQSRLRNPILAQMEDQATLPPIIGKIAVTTDAFVVKPILFAGGDIGKLAVCGSLNDLAVGGAKPAYLAVSFILEEGLAISRLETIVSSMALECETNHVQLVTADTKVVEKGYCDEIYITTTAIGQCLTANWSVHSAQIGDQIILSGPIGDHGAAIIAAREEFAFETTLSSDVASIWPLVESVIQGNIQVHCMRDPTRGGVAAVLNEIAVASQLGIRIIQQAIPVRKEVSSLCSLLGLDPLTLACEGRLIAVVHKGDSDRCLSILNRHPLGTQAAIVGEVVAEHPGVVSLVRPLGGEQLVPMPLGELLPRIC